MPSTVLASESVSASKTDWLHDFDLWLEIFVLFNFFCLFGDIALAHGSNRFRNSAEYIPLVFSPLAALLLFFGLFARVRSGRTPAWKNFGYFVAWLSLVVGAAGVIYHLDSHFFFDRTLKSLTYTAPFVAPLAYMGLGCLLLMNRFILHTAKEWPHWVLFFALGGFVGNFVLSLADHATNGFFHSTEWIPVVSSAFAVGFLFAALVAKISPAFYSLCLLVLFAQVLVGTLGFALHLWADLHGASGRLLDNVLSGAPPFAPLLLPNLAFLGWIGLRALETQQEESP